LRSVVMILPILFLQFCFVMVGGWVGLLAALRLLVLPSA
jgi:type IV secretory pathway TrbL component